MSTDLNNFIFPSGIDVEQVKRGLGSETNLEPGVSVFSGQTGGVAFRFFIHPEFNKLKSQLANYEVNDEVLMIEWYKDRFNKPVEQVRFLPPELLYIPNDPEDEVTGILADAYKRFKEGLKAPGLSLDKWGVLGPGDVKTLNSMKIFTVEQFAATRRDKIQGVLPSNFMEAFERAILFVNGKENRDQTRAQVEKMLEISKENSKLKERLEFLEARLSDGPALEPVRLTESGETFEKIGQIEIKRRGRPPKDKNGGDTNN